MRDPTVALYVLCGLVGATSLWRLSRRQGPQTALVTALCQLVLAATATLLMPTYRWWYPDRAPHWIFVGSATATLLGVALLAGRPSRPVDKLAARLRARPWATRLALLMASVVLTLGGLEFVASSAVRAGLARRYTPTETRLAEQTEDWRLAHVMSDDYREPDPDLLWQPVARAPYSSQRFRGPEVAPSKPAGVTRIICYGDSNTDGPLEGGAWPEALAALLEPNARGPIEVLNAGVAGYSSYQGRRRFERQVDTYRPDIVLVSFGWNDAANGISGEDKVYAATPAFQAVNPAVLRLRRWLLRYDAVLVAARLVSAPFAVPQDTPDTSYAPRVTLDDYAANLRAIVDRGRATGARVVLMTRPHRATVEDLTAAAGWRSRVPAYNDVVRRLAGVLPTPLVDAQQILASSPDLFVDESHLNRAGHRRLAQAVVRQLGEAGLVP